MSDAHEPARSHASEVKIMMPMNNFTRDRNGKTDSLRVLHLDFGPCDSPATRNIHLAAPHLPSVSRPVHKLVSNTRRWNKAMGGSSHKEQSSFSSPSTKGSTQIGLERGDRPKRHRRWLESLVEQQILISIFTIGSYFLPRQRWYQQEGVHDWTHRENKGRDEQ